MVVSRPLSEVRGPLQLTVHACYTVIEAISVALYFTSHDSGGGIVTSIAFLHRGGDIAVTTVLWHSRLIRS